MRRSFAFALAFALAACGRAPDPQQDFDSLDRELTDANSAGNLRDPTISAALHDQIMVDPTLAQSSNANAVRPPPRPDSGAVPLDVPSPDPVDPRTLRHAPAPSGTCPECTAKAGAFTLGALAALQRDVGTAKCAGAVSYSAGWANRLPADLPLYPDARLSEAAGTATDGCALRIVSFASSAPVGKVIDWYYTRATAAGYTADHRADTRIDTLGGTRGHDAYIVYVIPRQGGGTAVDLVSNAGR